MEEVSLQVKRSRGRPSKKKQEPTVNVVNELVNNAILVKFNVLKHNISDLEKEIHELTAK